MKKRYVLKNKTRFFTLLLVFIIMVSIFVSAVSVYGYKGQSYKIIRIQKGDTLWKIAKRYNKYGDIRKYIYELKTLNNFQGSIIYEGSELKIPD